MSLVRFETADTATHAQTGEGLTRIACAAGRSETGRPVGTCALRHDDGCANCGRTTEAGDCFSLDADTGSLSCAADGVAHRDEE
jgi:hypothetical protein